MLQVNTSREHTTRLTPVLNVNCDIKHRYRLQNKRNQLYYDTLSSNGCISTYSQVQEWRGQDLPANDFGWEDQGSRFVPRQGYDLICPKEIAGELKCSCKKGCLTASCTCVKNKFKCSIACRCGLECQNHGSVSNISDDFGLSSSESESESYE